MKKKKKRTIYRIQDKDGRGPWKPGFSNRWVEEKPHSDQLLPWFEEFGWVDIKTRNWGCGCASIEKLKRWFNRNEYLILLHYGYRAVKMKADEILAESENQIVFTKRKPLRKGVKEFRLYE